MIQISMVLILLMSACRLEAGSSEQLQRSIFWAGTKEYEDRAGKLRVSPTEAHDKLVANTREPPVGYFDRNPIFLCDDQYFFTLPSKKSSVRLQGYYVHGVTGRIEYRESDVAIEFGEELLPEGAFRSATVIYEP